MSIAKEVEIWRAQLRERHPHGRVEFMETIDVSGCDGPLTAEAHNASPISGPLFDEMIEATMARGAATKAESRWSMTR
jgi:hypothetical protein